MKLKNQQCVDNSTSLMVLRVRYWNRKVVISWKCWSGGRRQRVVEVAREVFDYENVGEKELKEMETKVCRKESA